MKNTLMTHVHTLASTVFCIGLALGLTACGAKEGDKRNDSGELESTEDGIAKDESNAEANSGDHSSIDRLEVLAPGELARKVYDAFGGGLTVVKNGNRSYDYIDANASSFVGSISNDPNNKYASSFSIGYFMALAGLSSVVGDNYAVKVYSKTAVRDCSTPAGAEAIMTAVAPSMTPSELKESAALMVEACKIDPSSAVKAVMQSYSFALKATL